jgi:hypothetical protein
MQGTKTIMGIGKSSVLKALTELQSETRSPLTAEERALLDTDFALDADMLDDKYNPNGDGQHPVFLREHWRGHVAQQNTLAGYWQWVEHSLNKYHEIA